MAISLNITQVRNVGVTLCLILLAACEHDYGKPVGQALAVVNGGEVTLHQVNAELESAAQSGVGVPGDLQKLALERVIDRELLVSQALQAKIDRDPAVMMAIERSKSQVLANAYLQGLTSLAARPSNAEVEAYIADHPDLFAGRKLYDFRYLSLSTASLNEAVTAQVDRAHSLDDLGAELRAGKVDFSEGRSYRSTSELPPQLLANLKAITERPVFVMRDGNRALLASLAYIKDAPLTGEAALREAEQYLASRLAASAAQNEIARLRLLAKIQYAKGSAPKISQRSNLSQGANGAASANPNAADQYATGALR